MAKDVRITPADGTIIFNNSVGSGSGKLEQSGDDLVLSNAVGDVLFGDVDSDVYIGDGVNNVDLIFEQNGSIRGESGNTVTLTVGSDETTLHLTGSTLALQKDGGFVGIGTTTPSTWLTVAGDISGSDMHLPRGGRVSFYGNNSVYHAMVAHDSSGNASDDLRINSYHNVYVNLDSNNNNSDSTTSFEISQHGAGSTLGTPFFVVRGDGKVGIGTASPAAMLDITGSSASDGRRFRVHGGSSGHSLEMVDRSGYTSSTPNVYIQDADNNGARATLQVTGNNGAIESMFVASNGNTGLGTTSPSYKLDVAGGFRATGQSHFNDVINISRGSTGNGMLVNQNVEGFQYYAEEGGSGQERYWIRFDYTNNASYPYLTNRTPNGAVVIKTGTAAGGGENEHFRINGGDGTVNAYFTGVNLGIGTSTPSTRLHVKGDAKISGSLLIEGGGGTGYGTDSHTACIAMARGGRGLSAEFGSGYYRNLIESNGIASITIGDNTSLISEIKIQAGSTSANGITTFYNSGSEAMRIHSNQRVGIGTTSPAALLDVNGTAQMSTGITENTHYVGTSLAHWGDGDTNIAFDTDSMVFKAGNVEFLKLSEGLTDQLIINEAGASVDVRIEGDTDTNLIRTDAANDRVGIGQGSPSYKLDVSGDIRATGALGVGVAPNSTDGRIDASNDIVAYSTSDRRLKENITPIENALDKVHEIQGVEFDWKPLQEEEVKTVHGNTGHDIGVIAQEIESILPEAVTTRENGYKAVRYEKIVPLLIQAVKEQQDQINELKDIINGLNS